jgi:hypothetical protein
VVARLRGKEGATWAACYWASQERTKGLGWAGGEVKKRK